MTISDVLFSINIIGAIASLGFIFYVLNVDRKRFAEEHRHLV